MDAGSTESALARGQVAGIERRLALAEANGKGGAEAAGESFEALFATLVIKELRRGLGQGFFGAGAGADVFEGWLDEHLGAALAKSWELDLAGVVKRGIEEKEARAQRGAVR